MVPESHGCAAELDPLRARARPLAVPGDWPLALSSVGGDFWAKKLSLFPGRFSGKGQLGVLRGPHARQRGAGAQTPGRGQAASSLIARVL